MKSRRAVSDYLRDMIVFAETAEDLLGGMDLEAFFAWMHRGDEESRAPAALPDALLPKLVRGDLRVLVEASQ